jgi:tRNA-splicing ligase RtcB (3'-phosphate/5'-hydroxy nucleic acid ligase)
MTKLKLNGKDLRKLGYPETKVIGIAIDVMQKNYKHSTEAEALDILARIMAAPDEFMEDNVLCKIAAEIVEKPEDADNTIALNDVIVPYEIYGADKIEDGALQQMNTAMRLPVSVAGALMPDAHQGYGLPIGGVLATDNAIIPYAVGVDIGCRMCLSIFDIPASYIAENDKSLMRLLNEKTLFGAGREFNKPTEHEVLERSEFNDIELLKRLQQKAVKQLGTSGSGNHFVEFGIVELLSDENELNVPAGKYMALLSHSGSRGLGATIAGHYTKVAMEQCPLPKEAKHLAWLDLNSQAGMEYWLAMNLAGDYASACHHTIHKKVADYFNVAPMAMVENHHNFAWKEMLNGKEAIVHRKGATPAGKGVLGIIPGSMTAPGFVVSGKGSAASLSSASHGAGRQLSRTKAQNSITDGELRKILADNGVTLLGGGLDEAPHAYKDIHEVMKAQTELVNVVATFLPKIVKMDGR